MTTPSTVKLIGITRRHGAALSSPWLLARALVPGTDCHAAPTATSAAAVGWPAPHACTIP